MNRPYVNRLVQRGAKAITDTKNTQQRQVVAAAGKLRVQVGKGRPTHGKTNN
jgi:hypothetical protein